MNNESHREQHSARLDDLSEAAAYRRLVSEFGSIMVTVFHADGAPAAQWVGHDVAEIAGYSPAELEADPNLWTNIVHPADRPGLRAVRASAGGCACARDEYRIYRKDGQMRRVGDTMIATAVEPDGLVRCIRSITDTTDLKQAEASLRESEQMYRSLVENLDAVVFRIDRDMRPLVMIGNVEKLVGYSNEEMMRHPALWRESIHPGDMNKVWELIATAEARRTAQVFEFRIRSRTGSTKWLRGALTPIYGDDGRLLFCDGVGIDITERREVEKARRDAEARYRELVDSLDAVIFRSDPRNVLVALYGHVREQTGYTVAEMMSNEQLWMQIIHPDDLERVREFYRNVAATGERSAVELRVVGKSGEVRWVRARVAPRYDEEGGIKWFDGVVVDVTESVEARQQEARRTARMQAITEISQAFSSSLEAKQILDTAAVRVSDVLQCPCLGLTIEPFWNHVGHMSVSCPAGCNIQDLERVIRRSKVTVDEVFGPGGVNARIVEDVAQASALGAVFAECLYAAGCGLPGPAVIAPITAGPDAVGMLIGVRARGLHFDQEDLLFLTDVASHASAALANAVLYSHKSRVAENLQRGLIPAEPAVDGLDIATLYVPAPGEAEVGGDFFDVFGIDDKLVGLVVGDVSGKGFEAAIHTAEARYMLRAFAHVDSDPQEVMTQLNETLVYYLPDEVFITLLYVVIDLAEHALTYVSAGHEVCLVRRDEDLEELPPTGEILGVTRGASYRSGKAAFEVGDILLCYTDGITEVRLNGEHFGYGRLRDALLEAPAGDSRAVVDHIMGRLRSLGTARQTDDQVVVVARALV